MSGSIRSWLKAGVCAAALGLVLGGAALAQSPYASDMQAGREAFDGSNYQLAERYFRGAYDNAQSDGQKATALYSLAVAAQKQGKTDEARQHASKAIEHSPKNSQAKRLLEELSQQAERAPAKGAKGQPRAEAPKAEPRPETARAEAKLDAQAKAPAAAKSQMAQPAEPSAVEKEAVLPALQRPPTKRAALATARGGQPSEGPAADTPRESAAAEPPVSAVAKSGRDGAPAAARVETAALPGAKRRDAERPARRIGATAAASEPVPASVTSAIPAQKSPLLAAGFVADGAQVALLTGPATVAEKADQSLEMKRIVLAPTGTAAASELFKLHADVAQGRLAIAPGGGLIASAVPLAAGSGKAPAKGMVVTVHVWDSASVDNTHAIEMPIADAAGVPAGIEAMAFSRNVRRLVIAHRTGLEILDTNGLKSAGSYRFPPRQRVEGGEAPISLAVSANGRNAVMANGTRLRVVDGASVRDMAPAGSKAVFDKVALSDDGRLIAAAGGSSVRFYDFASGRETAALPDAAGPVSAIAFSAGSDRLAVASPAGVKVWHVASRRLVNEASSPASAEQLMFSPDGRKLLAAASGGSAVLGLDAATPAAASTAAGPPPTQVATTAPAELPVAAPAPPASPPPAATPAKPAATEEARPKPAEPAPAVAAPASDPVKAEPAAPKVESKLAAEPVIPKLSKADLLSLRTMALEGLDCEKVKTLDSDIGDAGQHATCQSRVEARDKAAERAKLVAEHKAALERLDCSAARTLDEKLALGDARALAACSLEAVLKSGSARDLYLSAAKHDADRDRGPAKRLYRAIVDRFPDDELALKAAERMTAIADQEAADAQPRNRLPRGQRRP